MVKILYIITQSEIGGAQRYIFDLATNLNKSQYKVHIASGGSGGLLDRLKDEKIASHTLKHLVREINPIQDFLAYKEILALIIDIKPDIVHLNSSKAGVLGSMAAKIAGIKKIIYTAHGFVFNEPMNPLKRWIYKQAELGNAKRVNNIIAVSEFDRQSGIKAHVPEEKIITIHNGINPNIEFLSKDDARSSLLKKIQSRFPNTPIHQFTNSPILGTIANFYHTKGLDTLIQAMTNIDAKLIIIGEGALRPELENQIQKLNLSNKIFLIGSIQEAKKYLKAFDIFVLPSRKEGLSYTILEAAAAKIPIVATRVGGTPEIIQDTIDGYLCEPDNSDEFAQAIKKALDKPITPALKNNFLLSNMLAQTINLYSSI